MVIREYHKTREDGVRLFRTYSDTNRYLLQVETGVIYGDAIDVESANYTYEETDDIIVDTPPSDILHEDRGNQRP
jgi:hypothetical protein